MLLPRLAFAAQLRRVSAPPPRARLFSAAPAPRPTTPPTTPLAKPLNNPRKIIAMLLSYVWPASQPALRARVAVALALLIGAKVVNIQVPFLFKDAADYLAANAPPQQQQQQQQQQPPRAEQQPADGAAVPPLSAPRPSPAPLSPRLPPPPESRPLSVPQLAAALPLALILGYGLARSSAAGMAELRNAVFARVAQRAIRVVSRDVFRHLLALDLRFHLERQTGALQRTIDRGSRSINFVLTSLVFNIVPTALEIALVCGIFATQCGWEYAATTLATLVAYVSYTVSVTNERSLIRKEVNRLENSASARSTDALLNYESIKYFANEDTVVTAYDRTLAELDEAAIRAQISLSQLNFGQNVIFSAGITAAMAMASRDILAGSMTVGDLILVNGLLFQLSIPLNFVGMVYREVRQGLIDMEAMFALLDTPPRVRDSALAAPLVLPPRLLPPSELPAITAELVAAAAPAIRFHAVDFHYSPERQVLRNVSFDVAAGQTVAVVGPSGCGKSTLVRLLYRFFDVDEAAPVAVVGPGEDVGAALRPGVYIHGQDVRLVTQASLHAKVGVVPQDTTLFNDTIAFNIAFGSPGAAPGQAAIEEAARAASIHETIVANFPLGYKTVVGERGAKLSGGEKQRVAIARVLLKDAPIVCYDEATASLDSITEAGIMAALRALSSDRTTLIIAHRLSTVMFVDKIVVMEGGGVREQGTHQQLVSAGGLYARMWREQQQESRLRRQHHDQAPEGGD